MAEKDYKNVMHLGNPTNTIAVLNRYGFSFQKKFGQNFLIDENVVEKIVRDAGVTKDDFVLEIGPGIGTMTQILCENAREVVAVEIDDKLIPILTEDTLSWYDNVTVIHEDILKLDIVKLANERNGGKPIKVVANLPYYITTPIIMGLKAMCRWTALPLWCRRKWQTVCRSDREQRTTVRFRLRCSIMQSPRLY